MQSTARSLSLTSFVLLLAPIGVALGAGACGGGSKAGSASDAGVSAEDAGGPSPSDAGITSDAGVDAALVDGDTVPDASGSPDDAAPPDGAVDGGTTAVLVTATAQALDLDDTNVYYFANAPDGDGGTVASVYGVPKSGGTPFLVSSSSAPYYWGTSLHLIDGAFYWTQQTLGGFSLASAPATARGAAATVYGEVFDTRTFDFGVQAGSAYFVDPVAEIQALSLAPDGGNASAFFSYGINRDPQWLAFQLDSTNGTLDVLDDAQNAINRVSIATASETSSIPVAANTKMMAIHGAKLYWLTFGACPFDGGVCATSTLYGAGLDGSNPAVVARGVWPSQGVYAASYVTDAYAYVEIDESATINVTSSTLERIDLTTGQSQTVFANPSGGLGPFVADATYLYIGTPQGVLRIAN